MTGQALAAAAARTRFDLPPELSASEPPEARGLARDEVRLLVAQADARPPLSHALFRDIGRYLEAGDLLVVNTSATLAAAVDGTRASGERVVVHFSGDRGDGTWVVELRLPDGSGPVLDGAADETVILAGGDEIRLAASEIGSARRHGSRLWRANVATNEPVEAYLATHGRPITYAYLRGRWPLAAYQTIFAREPGSAEMPSAARPFSERVVTDLVGRGVLIAPITLHTAVSSLEADEPPQPERFSVPPATARLVNETHAAGHRVIAVGTTVTRALETAARDDGNVEACAGWTDVVLGPARPARVVDGLVTGWHAPEASHLLLLEAVAGEDLVRSAYDAALEQRYLWHEFGDSCLLLPRRR